MGTSAVETSAGGNRISLEERLADPRTAEALHRLLDRLDVVVFVFEAVEGFLGRAEVVADSISQSLGELRPLSQELVGEDAMARMPQVVRAAGRLAELTERPAIKNLLDSKLLDTLGQPETLEALQRLLDKLDLILVGLDAAEGFAQRSDTMVESVAEGAQDLREAAGTYSGTIEVLKDRLPKIIEIGEQLQDMGMFEPATIEVLARLGSAIAEGHRDFEAQPKEKLGLLKLLRTLGEPEIQTAIQLVLHVTRRYSQRVP